MVDAQATTAYFALGGDPESTRPTPEDETEAAAAAAAGLRASSDAVRGPSPPHASHVSSIATVADDGEMDPPAQSQATLNGTNLASAPGSAPGPGQGHGSGQAESASQQGSSVYPSTHPIQTPRRGAESVPNPVMTSGSTAGMMQTPVRPLASPTSARHYVDSFAQTPVFSTPQQKVPTDTDGVYFASYSGVDVLEYVVNGVSVMRRAQDSALNATQILKLAGLDKAKRTRMIERETHGQHEKVQGGYGKYQGTWVPFERGLALCEQFHVADLMEPLLHYDMSKATAQGTPSKESMRSKRMLGWESVQTPLNYAATPTQQQQRQRSQQPQISHLPSNSQSHQQQSTFLPPQITPHQQHPLSHPDLAGEEHLRVGTAALPPIEPDETNESIEAFECGRDVVTELFLGVDNSTTLATVLEAHAGEVVDVDVPIDDSGHTALHWAAALGRIDLVRDLVEHGAKCRRGNYAGESPLVRAVLVTNNSDLSSFGDLLDILYPSLHLADNQGRTVLHHIALTSGIKGRSDASRYYLETLLEWIVRRGSADRRGFNWLVEELVNAQDRNGDTALNIAARISNTHIARQLVDVGASVTVPNRAGLRPADFGIEVPRGSGQWGAGSGVGIGSNVAPNTGSSAGQNSGPNSGPTLGLNSANSRRGTSAVAVAAAAAAAAGSSHIQQSPAAGMKREQPDQQPAPEPISNPEERRSAVLDKIQGVVQELQTTYGQELGAKEELFTSVHQQLKDATTTHNNYKAQAQHLESLYETLGLARARVNALQTAVQSEDAKFRHETSANVPELDLNGTFDADEPFRVSIDSPDQLTLPPALLEARIAAYERNERRLVALRDELRASSRERQAKYRRVVSQCTGVDQDKVDGLLSSLVQAVESDSGSVDLSRVAGFLKKLEK